MTALFFHVFICSLLAYASCKDAKPRQDTVNGDLILTNVDRKIDISTHIAKITSSITIENTGKASVGFFLYAVEPSLQDNLSFLGASIKGDEDKDSSLTVAQTTVAGKGDKQFWRIKLPSGLENGKTVSVEVETVFSHALTPFPREITQAEKQFVVFTGNLYLFSPYKVTKQSTTVTTASSKIESYTKVKPFSQTETTINYGPYEDKEAFSEVELKVHSENNTPFLTITSLERIIEVSHWGNIAVEEHIEVRHTGALLKGPFSRYDYQRSQDTGASVKSFKTVLPTSARDVYYRDEIGNISTSALRESEDMVDIELRPRFPLYGGWKTKYYIGYNVPSYQYLFNDGDRYALKMRFVDHVFDNLVIDQMTFKIILPEGASHMHLSTPYDIEKGENTLHYTYLDTMGRPVIVAYKNNMVEQHIQDFELHYNFQKIMLLQEPVLVVLAFYLLFVLVIIYVRLDFSITKDEAKESKMRVASCAEDVQSTQDKRSALYQSYDDAIDKFKGGKDQQAYVSSRKKIDADYKQLTQHMQHLQAQLKSEGSDLAEKVAELNRLDQQYKDQITIAITQSERLVAGKIGKQTYIETEKGINDKREEIYRKMEELCASLN